MADERTAARLAEIGASLAAVALDPSCEVVQAEVYVEDVTWLNERLARLTDALREIAEYEEPWPQDPSDVYDHFQVVARAALAAGEGTDVGAYACSGGRSHLPACGGTCGNLDAAPAERVREATSQVQADAVIDVAKDVRGAPAEETGKGNTD